LSHPASITFFAKRTHSCRGHFHFLCDPGTDFSHARAIVRRGDAELLTISAKPVGVGAAYQQLLLVGERSSLLTRIAAMENGSLCVRMKS
jgi:hypothetical protein